MAPRLSAGKALAAVGQPVLLSSPRGRLEFLSVEFLSVDGNTLYYSGLGGGTFTTARIERDPVPVVLSRDSLFTVTGTSRPFQGSGLHPEGDRFILARFDSSARTDDGTTEPDRFILVQNFFEG